MWSRKEVNKRWVFAVLEFYTRRLAAIHSKHSNFMLSRKTLLLYVNVVLSPAAAKKCTWKTKLLSKQRSNASKKGIKRTTEKTLLILSSALYMHHHPSLSSPSSVFATAHYCYDLELTMCLEYQKSFRVPAALKTESEECCSFRWKSGFSTLQS